MGIVLRITEGAGEGTEQAVEASATLGRDAASADVVLDDAGVSRAHARVDAGGAVPLVEDLGSSNGTFVNGEPIGGAVELADGDRIQVGGTVLEVSGADSATRVMGAGDVATAEHLGPARPAPPPRPRDPGPGPGPSPKPLAPHPQEEGNIPALASAFLGPLSIFLLVFSTGAAFFVSFPCAIGAIVLASVGKRKVDRGETDAHRGFAVLGQVTGIVGAVLSTIALVAFLLIAVLLDTAVDSLSGILDELRDEIQDRSNNAGAVLDQAPDGAASPPPSS